MGVQQRIALNKADDPGSVSLIGGSTKGRRWGPGRRTQHERKHSHNSTSPSSRPRARTKLQAVACAHNTHCVGWVEVSSGRANACWCRPNLVDHSLFWGPFSRALRLLAGHVTGFKLGHIAPPQEKIATVARPGHHGPGRLSPRRMRVDGADTFCGVSPPEGREVTREGGAEGGARKPKFSWVSASHQLGVLAIAQ